jgi:hypothetical protein
MVRIQIDRLWIILCDQGRDDVRRRTVDGKRIIVRSKKFVDGGTKYRVDTDHMYRRLSRIVSSRKCLWAN